MAPWQVIRGQLGILDNLSLWSFDSFDASLLKLKVEKKLRKYRVVANANFERKQDFSNGIHFQDPEGIHDTVEAFKYVEKDLAKISNIFIVK